MNIIIFGYGVSGKYCASILLKNKKINKIFIIDSIKHKLNSTKIFQITLSEFLQKNYNCTHAIICTPSGEHFKYASICLNKNINVLIEKPFVLKLQEAKKLIENLKNKKIKCWTILQNRYNKAVVNLKKKINKLNFKNISFVDCTLYWKRDKKYYANNWRGRYSTDGGVLTNQGIHLLDALIYVFGKIKHFNALASYNKKKLQAEDQITINFLHRNNILSSYKATTRANRNYQAAIDVLSKDGRFKVRGISLNLFLNYKNNDFYVDKRNSENFSSKPGQKGGMGNGHYKILEEFLNTKIKKSSKNLEIKNNIYILQLIHSIYNNINKNISKVSDKQSILGR